MFRPFELESRYIERSWLAPSKTETSPRSRGPGLFGHLLCLEPCLDTAKSAAHFDHRRRCPSHAISSVRGISPCHCEDRILRIAGARQSRRQKSEFSSRANPVCASIAETAPGSFGTRSALITTRLNQALPEEAAPIWHFDTARATGQSPEVCHRWLPDMGSANSHSSCRANDRDPSVAAEPIELGGRASAEQRGATHLFHGTFSSGMNR